MTRLYMWLPQIARCGMIQEKPYMWVGVHWILCSRGAFPYRERALCTHLHPQKLLGLALHDPATALHAYLGFHCHGIRLEWIGKKRTRGERGSKYYLGDVLEDGSTGWIRNSVVASPTVRSGAVGRSADSGRRSDARSADRRVSGGRGGDVVRAAWWVARKCRTAGRRWRPHPNSLRHPLPLACHPLFCCEPHRTPPREKKGKYPASSAAPRSPQQQQRGGERTHAIAVATAARPPLK
jgi:hypothetical protein